MMRYKPLIIFGSGNVANIMGAYFEREYKNNIIYTVHKKFITSEKFRGRELIPFDDIENRYPPEEYDMFVAIGYDKLNHTRTRVYNEAKAKGYTLVNYIHKKANIDPTVIMGDNIFIFEFNNIQYNVKLGSNIILWSSNHIGHETIVRSNVYFASHVVVSGFCDIGENSFIGVNATFANNVKLGKNCLVGAGAYISKNTADAKVFVPTKSRVFSFDDLPSKIQNIWRPEGI